ncbi:MAG: NADP-dependent isocitrate dehydrogenase, partial [Cytophagales bacterium]
GQLPKQIQAVSYGEAKEMKLPTYKPKTPATKRLVGVDLFLHWSDRSAEKLGALVSQLKANQVELSMITNRGIKVYPDGFEETFCTDHWRCRFKPKDGYQMVKDDIISLLKQANDKSLDVVKTENLYEFDGKIAYSLGQGQ